MNKFTRKPNCSCDECNNPLYRRPAQLDRGAVFCSVRCSNIRKKVLVCCKVCGVEIPRKKNAKTCSRICANKSRVGSKYNLGQPNSIVSRSTKLRQILVAERGGNCNRCPFNFSEILHVHHVIERCNGGTDEHGNLELLCPNCHTMHHYILKLEARTKKLEG